MLIDFAVAQWADKALTVRWVRTRRRAIPSSPSPSRDRAGVHLVRVEVVNLATAESHAADFAFALTNARRTYRRSCVATPFSAEAKAKYGSSPAAFSPYSSATSAVAMNLGEAECGRAPSLRKIFRLGKVRAKKSATRIDNK